MKMISHGEEVEMSQWKDIPGYEGLYQASDDGRIRTSKDKITFTEKHGVRHWKQREMVQGFYKNGFMVTLWKNGNPKKYLSARIIASTFIENLLDSDMTVNHKDGNRRNNTAANLEWLTRADNIRHGFENGLYPQKSIILNDLVEVRQFESMAAASRYLGRKAGYVSNALKKGQRIRGNDGTTYKAYR